MSTLEINLIILTVVFAGVAVRSTLMWFDRTNLYRRLEYINKENVAIHEACKERNSILRQKYNELYERHVELDSIQKDTFRILSESQENNEELIAVIKTLRSENNTLKKNIKFSDN